MQWIHFPLVKATLFYTLGIALAPNSPISLTRLLVISLVTLALGFVLNHLGRRAITPKVSFGITIVLLFFILGQLNYHSRLPQNNAKHYSHFVNPTGQQLLQIKIYKPLKSTNYYDQYRAQILSIDSSVTNGVVLLQVKKDSSCIPLTIGLILMAKASFNTIDRAKNPNQFDYKKYLASTHIYYKITLSSTKLVKVQSEQKNLTYWAHKAQKKYSAILDSKINNPRAAAILKALLVGYKSDLDPKVKEHFAQAGVLHLLAVSGLHVGIVLLLVQGLCSFLKTLKHGHVALLCISIVAIWSFAAITGFSASVVRATFMFSLFAIGKQFNRGHNSINSLFVSMLIMLCIDPLELWQVGFQLSYAAVFFILLLYPKMVSLWTPKQLLFRRAWQLCCVSLSAQMGVMPLSLFYFHEFPTLFLISNLLLVPMIGTLLSTGLVLCSIQLFCTVPQWLFDILNSWVVYIHRFAQGVSNIDNAVIQSIYLSKGQTLALYIGLLLGLITITNYKKYWMRTFGICCCFFLFSTTLTILDRPKEELLIFHSFGQTLIGHKQNTTLDIYSDTITPNLYAVRGYRIAKGIKNHTITKLPRFARFKNKNILILGKKASVPIDSLKIDALIMTHNSQINLDRWLLMVKPKLVICDGSSYKNVINRWRKTALKYGISFHDTNINGAYRFKPKD